MDVDRSITGAEAVATWERLVDERGALLFVRMDNGPELIVWIVRDWCRLRGLGIIYIEPGRRGRTRGSSRSTAESETNC